MQCVNDPCLFICYKRRLAVGVHTDDCLIVDKDSVRAAFRKQFSSKYPIKSLGFPKLWCGLQMERVDGSIRIFMKTFTEKLLEKFWQGKVNHSYSPLGMDKLLDEDPPDKDN